MKAIDAVSFTLDLDRFIRLPPYPLTHLEDVEKREKKVGDA